jgi:hypothetical protein
MTTPNNLGLHLGLNEFFYENRSVALYDINHSQNLKQIELSLKYCRGFIITPHDMNAIDLSKH